MSENIELRFSEAVRSGLPAAVVSALTDFMEAARAAFGPEDLLSAVLFGSAAEGRLRSASDVNLLLVLRRFPDEAAERMESQLNFARAAVRLRVIFILESELDAAADLFAQRVNDIVKRHEVIWGTDLFPKVHISPEALRARTAQVLLNLQIRLRERVAANWSRDDQLVSILTETIGSVRSCAANVLELEGRPADTPKHALAMLAAGAPEAQWQALPAYYSRLREGGAAPHGTLAGAAMGTIGLIGWMYRRVANG